jgi:hypothetical protein
MRNIIALTTALTLIVSAPVMAFQAAISVPNGTGAQVRTGINNALQAVATAQSGSSPPSTTYAYQQWIDTGYNPAVLRVRSADNTAWIPLGTLSVSGGYVASSSADSSKLNGQTAAYYQPAGTAITSANIGSQSVSYANSAGSAATATTATTATTSNGVAWSNVTGKPTGYSGTVSSMGLSITTVDGIITAMSVSQ